MALVKLTSLGGPEVPRGHVFYLSAESICRIEPYEDAVCRGSRVFMHWQVSTVVYFTLETPEKIAEIVGGAPAGPPQACVWCADERWKLGDLKPLIDNPKAHGLVVDQVRKIRDDAVREERNRIREILMNPDTLRTLAQLDRNDPDVRASCVPEAIALYEDGVAAGRNIERRARGER